MAYCVFHCCWKPACSSTGAALPPLQRLWRQKKKRQQSERPASAAFGHLSSQTPRAVSPRRRTDDSTRANVFDGKTMGSQSGNAAGAGLRQTSSSPITSPPFVETFEWRANICLHVTGQEMLFGCKLNYGNNCFLKRVNRQRGQPKVVPLEAKHDVQKCSS